MKKGIAPIVIVAAAVIFAASLFVYSRSTHAPRADDSGWSQTGVSNVVRANNRFAFRMYSELASKNGNVFYSPYSVFSAFAMVYEGARGRTASEIDGVFGYPNYAVLRPNFAHIYNNVNSLGVRAGNALWVQKGFTLLENYTQAVGRYYGGRAENVDFVHETERARTTINKYVEKQTNGRIKNLIPGGCIDSNTRLVLTNAIYFKEAWEKKFDKARESDFHVNGTTIKVPMMCMKPEGEFNYTKTDKFQAVELPYKNDKFSMIVVLPKNESANLTFDEFESLNMTPEHMDRICIPKFELNTKYFMKKDLRKLGITDAFSSAADFSGIDGRRDLLIDFVIHQAYIKVDEKGTEAAAATAVGMKLAAVRGFSFVADHPFTFIIRENDNGAILFMGRVVNPNEKK